MARFLLYEELNDDLAQEKKQVKIIAEVYKFKNGKVVASFNLPVPSVFIFDNLDMFCSVYCNEKYKLHQLPEKEMD